MGSTSTICWFFIHCTLCPKLLITLHLRLMRNGGVFFLVPLIISLCLVSAPLAFMELALGQFTSKPAASIFSRINPISAGIGFSMIVMRFVLAVSVKTEHRLGSLTWEVMGSAFFERRNVECLTEKLRDCYLPNKCPPPNIFHLGQCFDLPQLTKRNLLTTESTIYLSTRLMLNEEVYKDEYNLPIPRVRRVLGAVPGGHRVDGTLMFFVLSPFIVIFSLIALISALITLLTSGYYRVFGKFISILNNDASYLLSPDTWIEAVVVSLMLLSVADGTLHSLGASGEFGNRIHRNVLQLIPFAVLYIVLCSIVFGIATTVGLELEFRNDRRFDVPAETLRDLVQKNIADLDFASPFYYYTVSNPSVKASSALLLVSFILLSTAEYVVIAEDVLLLAVHFCPVFLKISSTMVRHCVLSIMYLILSAVYFNLTYTNYIEKSYGTLHIAICALAVWECASVSWLYTTHRFLVNIRTMGTASHPPIMYGQNISVILHFLWRYVIPSSLFIAAIFGLLSRTHFIELSWTSFLTSFIVFLPSFYGIKMITSYRSREAVMLSLFRTSDRWGPLSIQHKKITEFDEKAARIID
ncbi:hypothetical protein Q1695_011553 [Nippostrongylus brasiliensis]|nr:hypothetical protein Q1695_011553 [Nippostrongylus brasiliensis]